MTKSKSTLFTVHFTLLSKFQFNYAFYSLALFLFVSLFLPILSNLWHFHWPTIYKLIFPTLINLFLHVAFHTKSWSNVKDIMTRYPCNNLWHLILCKCIETAHESTLMRPWDPLYKCFYLRQAPSERLIQPNYY